MSFLWGFFNVKSPWNFGTILTINNRKLGWKRSCILNAMSCRHFPLTSCHLGLGAKHLARAFSKHQTFFREKKGNYIWHPPARNETAFKKLLTVLILSDHFFQNFILKGEGFHFSMTTTKRVRRRVTPKKFFSPLLAFYNSSKQPAVEKM